MSEQLPIDGTGTDEEDDAKLAKQSKRMVNRLIDMVNGYAVDRNRIRSLVLFEERTAKGGFHPISSVAYSDRPEVELVLYHRDQTVKLAKTLAIAEKAVERFNAADEVLPPSEWEAFQGCLKEINALKAHQLKHVTAMETLLATLNKQQADRETIMARLAADAATLTQKATEHQDKMALAHKQAAIPTASELKQRLALKYNVPVDQVDAILGAKAVESDAAADG